jgi:hypothetical protein
MAKADSARSGGPRRAQVEWIERTQSEWQRLEKLSNDRIWNDGRDLTEEEIFERVFEVQARRGRLARAWRTLRRAAIYAGVRMGGYRALAAR